MSNNNIIENQQESTSSNDSNPDNAILVEFTSGEGGLRPVGLFSHKNQTELAEKSNRAVDSAMNTVKNMAQRVHSTVQRIENRPNNVEVEFGIKFDAEIGVIVAKARGEASMVVKLRWDNK